MKRNEGSPAGVVRVEFEGAQVGPIDTHPSGKKVAALRAPKTPRNLVPVEAVPPSESGGAGKGGMSDAYLAKLLQFISVHQTYPRASLRDEEEGVVELELTIDAAGRLASGVMTKSSGFSRLDEAALKTIHELGVFPMPEGWNGGLTLVVPIRYQITRRK